jgi:HEPN pEK499 p136
MEFLQEFEREFMRRTLTLVKDYKGPFDATLLLNCLLGLLVVPKESSIDKIPTDPVVNLKNWGITPSSIRAFGKQTEKNQYPQTLRGIVHNLRNSVAHFRFAPIHSNRIVKGFAFTDASGFDAIIDIDEMRDFV